MKSNKETAAVVTLHQHWFFAWQKQVFAALKARDITPGGFTVLMRLASYADHADGRNARPSVKTLEEEVGVCRRTVSTALSSGEAAGLIVRTKQGYDNGFTSSAAVFDMIADPKQHEQQDAQAEQHEQQDAQAESSVGNSVRNQLHPTETVPRPTPRNRTKEPKNQRTRLGSGIKKKVGGVGSEVPQFGKIDWDSVEAEVGASSRNFSRNLHRDAASHSDEASLGVAAFAVPRRSVSRSDLKQRIARAKRTNLVNDYEPDVDLG